MHSPAWSQIGQSSGWLMRRNSIVAARERADLLGRRLDRQAVLERHRAGRLDLRDALDLDQAHAALADDREARVVAEVRDVDAGELRGVDEVEVLRDLDRLAVEDDRERVLRRRRAAEPGAGVRLASGGLRAHVGRRPSAPSVRPDEAALVARRGARYSSRNFATPEESGAAIAASAKTQIVMPLAIWPPIAAQEVDVLGAALAVLDAGQDLVEPGVPSRHGVHWPQDSCEKNFDDVHDARVDDAGVLVHHDDRRRAEHRALARRRRRSRAGTSSISSAVSIAAEAPPGMTALSFLPPGMPAA